MGPADGVDVCPIGALWPYPWNKAQTALETTEPQHLETWSRGGHKKKTTFGLGFRFKGPVNAHFRLLPLSSSWLQYTQGQP